MNLQELDDVKLAATYTSVYDELVRRSLIAEGYLRNGNTLANHIDRMVMKKIKGLVDMPVTERLRAELKKTK